jgi:hypothetical protein
VKFSWNKANGQLRQWTSVGAECWHAWMLCRNGLDFLYDLCIYEILFSYRHLHKVWGKKSD